ncbi:MAG: SBBP repeat-containing protein [Proteobacteria bacterium]|nr:SBBP repeat-containing protein [Pseudomonadota bacterium]
MRTRLLRISTYLVGLALCACGGGGNAGAPGTGTGAPGTGTGAPGVPADCAGVPPLAQLRTNCSMSSPGTPTAWARCIGGLTDEDGNDVAVGVDGSIFIGAGFGGFFSDARAKIVSCLQSTPEMLGTTDVLGMPVTTNGDEDPLVAKLDPNGNLLWVRSAPGPGGEGEVRALAVDPLDNSVIVVGDFEGTADFGGAVLGSPGHRDLFIAAFDTNGGMQWAETAVIMPDAAGNDSADAWGVAIDGMENIIVTGDFQGIMTVGVQPNTQTIMAQGATDMFVADFTRTGQLIWIDDAGGAGGGAEAYSAGRDVTVEPDGTFVVVGDFAGGATEHLTDTVGNFIDVPEYAGPGRAREAADMILVHYANNGALMWATHAGYPHTRTWGEGVSHDSLGNIYVTGEFRDCVFFRKQAMLPNVPAPPSPVDPNALAPPPCVDNGVDAVLQSTAGRDIFIAKYDQQGNFLWARNAGGEGTDRGYEIQVVDGPGAPPGSPFLYLGARTRSKMAVFGTPPVTQTVGSPGTRDAHVVAQYDLEGNLRWVQAFGGEGDSDLYGIGVDRRDGSVVGIGNFSGMGLFPGGVTLQSASSELQSDDIAVWKLPATGM